MASVSMKLNSGGWGLIYEVKCKKIDAIYIGKTKQTFKRIMNDYFYGVQGILKNG